MKRIISAIISVITMFTCMAFNASHYSQSGTYYIQAEELADNSISYEIAENESGEKIAVVTDYTGDAKSLVIPSELEGYRVEQIAYEAFMYCDSLTDVVIPDSVKIIDESAFYYCTNLTDIKIPDSVVEIGYEAFENTKWLLNQADGVIYAGKMVYEYKGEMSENTEIIIKEGVKNICSEAFEGCTGLSKITLPEGMTAIQQGAFSDCTSLSQINFPESITHIGYGAFENTKWLDSHPDGVVYIGKIAYCYLGEPSVDKIDISEGTVLISEGAFAECKNISKITLPKSLILIEDASFYNCPDLTEIIFSDGLTSIGAGAFYGCTSLRQINLPKELTIINYSTFFECTSLSEIILPEGLTTIDYGAFFGCKSLCKINLPDGLTTIQQLAFCGCEGLNDIKLPQGVTTIASGTFGNCTGLSKITLPESMSLICDYAFAGCTDLSEITLPESVVSIDPSAFEECSESLLIKGYDGSYAQSYANENNINYITLEKKEPVITIPDITEVLAGDANNDGIVSAIDLATLVKYIINSSQTQINVENSDLSQDGVVDAADLQKLKLIFLDN